MNKVFFQRQRDLSIHLGYSIVDRTVAFSEHDGLSLPARVILIVSIRD